MDNWKPSKAGNEAGVEESTTRPTTPVPDGRKELGGRLTPQDVRGLGSKIVPDGDFARLVPIGDAARREFSAVVEKMVEDPEWRPRASENMFWKAAPEPLFEGKNFSDTESEAEGKRQPLYDGYYRLNMNIRPANEGLGWVFGKGSASREVDFILCVRGGLGIRHRHARFKHNTDDLLVLHADHHQVILDGAELIQSSSKVLSTASTGIACGQLSFRFEYETQFASLYKKQLAASRKLRGDSDANVHMDSTPSATDFELRGYTVKKIIAQGSTCTVAAGIHRKSGVLVAVKLLKRNAENMQSIQNEENMLRLIGEHRHLCALKEVIAEPTLQSKLDEVFMVFTPLAEQTLADAVVSNATVAERLGLFKQCLDGLKYIHSKGVMHRDIKPKNIGIVLGNYPRVVILDFGLAKYAEVSTNHMAGTIPYLAPEVIALKRKLSTLPYTKWADLWSLGVCGYELFNKKFERGLNRGITRECYERMQLVLDSFGEKEKTIVKQMMHWNASERRMPSLMLEGHRKIEAANNHKRPLPDDGDEGS